MIGDRDDDRRLPGQRVSAVRRRAKYLLIETPTGTAMLHLGMSGSLRVVTPDDPVRTHDHVDIVLSNGRILRLNDPRRFGCVLSFVEGETHPLLANLGVEPLGNEFSGEYLFERAQKRRVAVKNFIMDSRIVVGVGNIYAAESLFSARIRPGVAAGRLPLHAYERLATAIRDVLARSVTEGGTTLRDFVGSDGQPGYFKQRLNVYGREGEPCRDCATVLTGFVLGGRSTVYCGTCQPARGYALAKET